MSNVIYLQNHIAINEIKNILDITHNDATSVYMTLSENKTLAAALRIIGFKSVKQISQDEWPLLRRWRDNYFPKTKDSKK